jgi:hypothetical protein
VKVAGGRRGSKPGTERYVSEGSIPVAAAGRTNFGSFLIAIACSKGVNSQATCFSRSCGLFVVRRLTLAWDSTGCLELRLGRLSSPTRKPKAGRPPEPGW